MMGRKTELRMDFRGNLQDMSLVRRDQGAKKIEKMLNFKKKKLMNQGSKEIFKCGA